MSRATIAVALSSTLLLAACTEQRTPAASPTADPTQPAAGTASPAPTESAPPPQASPTPSAPKRVGADGPTVAGLRFRLTTAEVALKRGGTISLTLEVENMTAGDLQLPLPTGRCGLYADLRFTPALESTGRAHTVKPGAYTGSVVTVPAGKTAKLTFTLARGADGALTVPTVHGAEGCGQGFASGATTRVELRYRIHVGAGQNPWANLTYTKPRWTGGELVSNPVGIDLP